MKVVILAGGRGTRLSEETEVIPKPMVEVGGKPILWHIMKTYSHYGHNDFIVCLGYRGYLIKEYFSHYYLHTTDVIIDLQQNRTIPTKSYSEPWKITLVDTGSETMTGGRLLKVRDYVGNADFFMTYGDGLSDVNIKELRQFHLKNKKMATVTAVQPLGRFGSLDIKRGEDAVHSFLEKPVGDNYWANGGFFVLKPDIFDHIKNGDDSVWEKEPLEDIAKDGELVAFKHTGFWKSMDTLRDKIELNNLWHKGQAPWKVWE